MSEYYRRDGTKCSSVKEWARDFDVDRKVKNTVLPDGARISTIFLGLDHQFCGNGPPLIFETMVFGGPLDKCRKWRYSTEEDVLEGHFRIMEDYEDLCDRRDAASEDDLNLGVGQ